MSIQSAQTSNNAFSIKKYRTSDSIIEQYSSTLLLIENQNREMHSPQTAALLPILYGQCLSVILSLSYIFNQLTNAAGIYSSLFPNEIMYHLLAFVCIFKHKEIAKRLFKRDGTSSSQTTVVALWIGLGIVDIISNTCILKSFQYTSGVSAVLISSTSAIFTVPLSYLFLGQKYTKLHLGGICIVVVGLALINYTKYKAAAENGESETFEVIGSLLATGAALGFATTTVIQTKLIIAVDHGYPWASISSYGVVSSILSAIIANTTDFGQADRDALIRSSDPRAWFITGLILSSFTFYLLTPVYLQRYSAVNFQVSILTADIGVYLFNVFYLKTKLSPLYITGFFTVLLGLVAFNLAFLRQDGAHKRLLRQSCTSGGAVERPNDDDVVALDLQD